MIKAIQEFFGGRLRSGKPNADEEASGEHALRLAAATLLVQVMRADHEVDPSERAAILAALTGTFSLPVEEATELLALAEAEADTAIGLYSFTRMLNEHLGREERTNLVEMMWQVVYADGVKDAEEEHLVRKVAKLLHVHHRDFIATRQRVERSVRGSE